MSSQQPPVFRHWTSMVQAGMQAFVRRGNLCIWIRSEERPGVRMCWSEPLGSNPDTTSPNLQSFQSVVSAWLCGDVQDWIHFLYSVFLLWVCVYSLGNGASSVENCFQFLTSSLVQQCEPGLRRPPPDHKASFIFLILGSSLCHWCQTASRAHWITLGRPEWTVWFMSQVRGSVCCSEHNAEQLWVQMKCSSVSFPRLPDMNSASSWCGFRLTPGLGLQVSESVWACFTGWTRVSTLM